MTEDQRMHLSSGLTIISRWGESAKPIQALVITRKKPKTNTTSKVDMELGLKAMTIWELSQTPNC